MMKGKPYVSSTVFISYFIKRSLSCSSGADSQPFLPGGRTGLSCLGGGGKRWEESYSHEGGGNFHSILSGTAAL